MVRLRIETFGLKAINRTLEAYIDATTDLTPAWLKIGTALAQKNRQTFERGNTVWPALSEPYGSWKEAHFPGRPILVRTGALYDHLTSEFDIAEVGRHSARFGTALGYGMYHQTGTPRMPARPPLAMDEAFKRKVVKILQAHLAEARGSASGIIMDGAA